MDNKVTVDTMVNTKRVDTTVDTKRVATTVDTKRVATTVDTKKAVTTVDTKRAATTVNTMRVATTVNTDTSNNMVVMDMAVTAHITAHLMVTAAVVMEAMVHIITDTAAVTTKTLITKLQ